MANQEHLDIIYSGPAAITAWKKMHPDIVFDLSQANLYRVKVAGINLTGANLTNASLVNADLSGSDLSYADLSGSDLSGAKLTNANLSHAKLTNANLSDAKLIKTNLADAILDSMILTGSTILPTGDTWKSYIEEVVPILLTSGGKTLVDVLDTGCWDCHRWLNCPMHAAFDANEINDIPILFRPRAEQFIQFFDARLIPQPIKL